jgi:hypothetical protein
MAEFLVRSLLKIVNQRPAVVVPTENFRSMRWITLVTTDPVSVGQ